jgi:predicted nucleotidyltransferase component of viral defense system
VRTYELNELLGTKLRALYQRKKGRDLFDLWRGLSLPGVEPGKVVGAFQRYMAHEGHPITRSQFSQNMALKMADEAFVADISALLAAGLEYDPVQAAGEIELELISKLE